MKPVSQLAVNQVPLFFTPKMVAHFNSSSPSAAKPEKVIGAWLSLVRIRDRIVFETANALGIPIAWNLAGGYQVASDGGITEVFAMHSNTMLECVEVYVCKGNSNVV
jgi:hypothetical protein